MTVLFITFQQVHRVVRTDDETNRKQVARQSVAFFVHADDDVILQPIIGSHDYEAITVRDFFKERTTKAESLMHHT